MMFPRSILVSFVILSTALVSFSAVSVSADNVDTTTSVLRQRKSIDEQGKQALLDHADDGIDIDHELYREEDGMIEADEVRFGRQYFCGVIGIGIGIGISSRDKNEK